MNGKRQEPHTPRSIVAGGFCRVPNIFLDKVMPVVRPCEFKVLLFVWRRIDGWGKLRDKISLTQIQRGARVSRKVAVTAVRFWEQVGFFRRTGRSGIRGTVEYEIVPHFDRDVVISVLTELVHPGNRLKKYPSTSAVCDPSLVHPGNTQKKVSETKTRERKGPSQTMASSSKKRLPVQVLKVLAEKQRLDDISHLERLLARGQGTSEVKARCRKQLEKLQAGR